MFAERNKSKGNQMSKIKCTECGYEASKAEALEYEYCPECEECFDIPEEFYEEAN